MSGSLVCGSTNSNWSLELGKNFSYRLSQTMSNYFLKSMRALQSIQSLVRMFSVRVKRKATKTSEQEKDARETIKR